MKNVAEKSYFLVGKKCFFHRYCDGGFRTKWTGLWRLTRKYLEYYAIKINEEWLSPSNIQTFVEEKETVKHIYSLKDFVVEEEVFVPENEPILIIVLNVKNNSNETKDLKIEFEIAANIRDWNEDWYERDYEITYRKNHFVIKSEKGKLAFVSSTNGNFIGYHFYKTHYPEGKLQKCFVTKNFLIEDRVNSNEEKKFSFLFACDKDEIFELEALLKNYDYLVGEKRAIYKKLLEENNFFSSIDFLNDLFRIAVFNLKKSIVDFNNQKVFIAGYPWFTQVWGRDSLLSIALNQFDEEACRNTLKLLAKYQSEEGKIPNIILLDGKVDYNSSDATPLFPIALDSYLKRFGNVSLVLDLKDTLYKIFDFYKRNKNEDGFVYSPKNSTWMDSLEREGYCIEVQVFWQKALEILSDLFEILEDDKSAKEATQLAKTLKTNILKKFAKGKYFVDRIGSDIETINPLFLFVFGLVERRDLLNYIEENFETEVGLSTINKNSAHYKPSSYHSGCTWSHLLALLSSVQFKKMRVDKALENLRKIYVKTQEHALNCIPEVWDSENGSLYVDKPVGREISSFIQAWSAAAVIRAIDEMLGIEIDALKNVIKVSPKMEGEFKRVLKIGEDVVELQITFKEAKVDVLYKSKLNKNYKIIALPEI
ncbi:MAG: amylo-alpha-1,6-glucosidase [Candidatus Aenigmarchaeota archaeon]|nr:amylo-alpha-1,6-glucosidase [Candidatus Aenigmarchaeota archaeon]